jgi:hypothetical protein
MANYGNTNNRLETGGYLFAGTKGRKAGIFTLDREIEVAFTLAAHGVRARNIPSRGVMI